MLMLPFGIEFRKTRSRNNPSSAFLGVVVIICWPHGDIMRLRTGSTAARRAGLEGNLVLVNSQLFSTSSKTVMSYK
ncbi:hypothetical protein V6N13_066858 [Hibiscus sabdariffa]|uniref:Uncharacterized protein n=1 Tax=Hibiscus sabdariffa TaxID=183260 RepID=A0ABR2DSU2_9ROSI